MKRINLGSVAVVLIVVGCVILAARATRTIQAKLDSVRDQSRDASRFADRYRAAVRWTRWHPKR